MPNVRQRLLSLRSSPSPWSVAVLLAFCLGALVACGGGSDGNGDGGVTDRDGGVPSGDGGVTGGDGDGAADAGLSDAPGAGPAVLDTSRVINSKTACLLDEECASDLHCFQGACVFECDSNGDCGGEDTCSPRRRCEKAQQDGAAGQSNPATPEVVPGIGIASAIPEVLLVQPGEEMVDCTFTTTEPVPDGFVGYTVETYDYRQAQGQPPTQVRRAKGTDSFTISVPAGAADPDADNPSIVEVQLATSVGTYRTTLAPAPSASGIYAGTVMVNRFGSVGLPIDFEIVTEPSGATLSSADKVYLVLPVRPGSVFSPVSAVDGTEAVTTLLTFDDFSQEWVATVRAPFAFPEGSNLARYGGSQVIRGLRFSLTDLGDGLVGTVRDSWEGLFDERTADGVVSPGTVVFTGKVDVSRVAKARPLDQVPALYASTSDSVAALSLPDLDVACAGQDFATLSPAAITVDGVDTNCTTITTIDEFEMAPASEQTACAVNVAETALMGDTTAKLIESFLAPDMGQNPGDQSFSDFMKDCAAGKDDQCRPSAAVLCARGLTSFAVASQRDPVALFPALYDAYARVTNETFLGQQLAAYQTDADTRLEWLRTTDYPAIVTEQVRKLNEDLLNTWRDQVLVAHFGALQGLFDDAGLAVLSREVQDTNVASRRQNLLLEMTQSWRSTMESLTVATRRWNDLYQDLEDRSREAAYVSDQATDLYVMGGLVAELNDAAGSSYASSALAAGFASLTSELRRLALPFSGLVFERDAEVVVSRSLDPLSTDDTLLSEIEASAREELRKAATQVTGIIERAQEKLVSETLLNNELNNRVQEHLDDLIAMCGTPEGCDPTVQELRDTPECWPLVSMGQCGFVADVANNGTTEAPQLDVTVRALGSGGNISEAGEALLEVEKAVAALRGSEQALFEYKKVTRQMLARADETDRTLAKWNRDYEDYLVVVMENDALIAQSRADGKDLLNNTYEALKKTREKAFESRAEFAQDMYDYQSAAGQRDIRELRAQAGLSRVANTARNVADNIWNVGTAVVDTINYSTDAAESASSAAQLAAITTLGAVTVGINAGAEIAEISADVIAAEREVQATLDATELLRLELAGDAAAGKFEDDLAEVEAAFMLEDSLGAVDEMIWQDIIVRERDQLGLLREYDRALIAAAQRRDDIFARIVGEFDRSLQVQQAEYTVQQRQRAYARIVQRAQLLDGRLRNLVEQRAQTNLNLGSPSVVFGWANRLEQAENSLERAKDELMDWVVALEYLAVRPFMDARLQILLARNTYQLEEIAESLEEIQKRCGGAINKNVSTLSLRDDILGLTSSLKDPVTDVTYSPAETFRAVLANANIPVDKRLRFSADATIGDIVSRGNVWAVTFDVGLSEFANLASSCNAKIQDISIQLVGDDLGSAQPTVNVAYDGTSTVRSCQPDIETLVDNIGRDATSFGAITLFNAPGRVLSPVAGIGDFGEVNQTLVGLPLASQYTVIIDPTLGENSKVDWTKLEDVEIRVTYAYQDFFPAGQCQ